MPKMPFQTGRLSRRHGLACLRPAMAERAATTGPSATPRRIWSIAAIVLAGLGTTLALRTLLHLLRHHQVLWERL